MVILTKSDTIIYSDVEVQMLADFFDENVSYGFGVTGIMEKWFDLPLDKLVLEPLLEQIDSNFRSKHDTLNVTLDKRLPHGVINLIESFRESEKIHGKIIPSYTIFLLSPNDALSFEKV